MADYESEKALAAAHAVKAVRDGMLVGLGSGSTASYAIRKLGRCIQAGLRIEDVATSEASAALARSVGIVFVPLERRSEEHTSELQSLMRISYAVFCLKKKKTP